MLKIAFSKAFVLSKPGIKISVENFSSHRAEKSRRSFWSIKKFWFPRTLGNAKGGTITTSVGKIVSAEKIPFDLLEG